MSGQIHERVDILTDVLMSEGQLGKEKVREDWVDEVDGCEF